MILGDNDFTGVSFVGIDKFVFGAAAKAVFSQSFVNARRRRRRDHGPGGEPVIVGDGKANTVAFQLEKYGSGNPSIDVSDVVFNVVDGRS